jgi:antirestriction protein ArdC
VLKADSRAILTAAAKAEEASALVLRLGRRSEEPREMSDEVLPEAA